MSNEFKHASVGTELTQAEWEALSTHVADGQTTGDILYFNGTYWVRTNILFIDGVNSRVGIGTTSPAVQLHLYKNTSSARGNLRLMASDWDSTYAGYDIDWYNGYSGGRPVVRISGVQDSGGHAYISFSVGPDTYYEYLRIVTGGNVGIGNTSPGYLLTMEASGGGYYSASDHQWHNSSSRRWKENIASLPSGLEIVKKLNPVSFDWKLFDQVKKDTAGVASGTNSWMTGGKKNQLGFIAEEIGEVLPDTVDWSVDDKGSADGYSLASILAVAVKAIQELVGRVEKLEGK